MGDHGFLPIGLVKPSIHDQRWWNMTPGIQTFTMKIDQ
jgi:hypothetical protein